MNPIAIDFECYYNKTYSVNAVDVFSFVNDPLFDPYLVSLWSPEIQWVGHPKDFDWSKLKDYDTAIAHNASFDKVVLDKCVELGLITWKPQSWICTANMSAYFLGLRSLKNAAKHLLGIEVDKQIRDDLKNLTWQDIEANVEVAKTLQTRIDDPETTVKQRETALKALQKLVLPENVKSYGLEDSRLSWVIYERFWDKWPEKERKLSDLTIKRGHKGVFIDKELLAAALVKVKKYKEIALGRLPWVKDGFLPLSPEAIEAECTKIGVAKPRSLAKTSEEAERWIKDNSKHRWIRAIGSVRRLNMLEARMQTMLDRVRADGTMPFELLYCGAHTKRESGAGGLNVQNFYKNKLYGIDLRKYIIAPKGYKLVIADLSQIEARVLLALVKDEETLGLIEKGVNIYEAHARKSMGWKGGELSIENPSTYALAKARILALGFGAGWQKFIMMVKSYGLLAEKVFGHEYSKQDKSDFVKYQEYVEPSYDLDSHSPLLQKIHINAWKEVRDFRLTNPKIAYKRKKYGGSSDGKEDGIWARLHKRLEDNIGYTYDLKLPSGNKLTYRELKQEHGDIAGVIPRRVHGKEQFLRVKLYGGLLTENAVQATARDIFVEKMLALYEAGYDVLFSVHDELLLLIKNEVDSKPISDIIKQRIEWLPNLPIDCKIKETNCYLK